MEKKDTIKKNSFDFEAIRQSPAVQVAEQEIVDGFEKMNQQGGVEAPVQTPPSNTEDSNTVRRFHKEPTRDILVHCPASLHTRLTNYKMKLWDDLGERKTINNMVVEAIADWLDKIEGRIEY